MFRDIFSYVVKMLSRVAEQLCNFILTNTMVSFQLHLLPWPLSASTICGTIGWAGGGCSNVLELAGKVMEWAAYFQCPGTLEAIKESHHGSFSMVA